MVIQNCNKISTKLQAAQRWLSVGAALLPAQSNSKYLVSGYGPVKRAIKTQSEAWRWFGQGDYNLAILLPPGLFCLDFEDDSTFTSWSDALAAELQDTYTETSPRGWHVFYAGDPPADKRLIPGVEVKRVVLVAPSRIGNFVYSPAGRGRFLDIQDNLSQVFASFLLSEKSEALTEVQPAEYIPDRPHHDGLVVKIKTVIDIKEYASSLTQLTTSDHGRGRWWRGCCPFHDDTHPSFWIDSGRGTWGCHACGVRGDVINLYAAHEGVTVPEAIRALAGVLDG